MGKIKKKQPTIIELKLVSQTITIIIIK